MMWSWASSETSSSKARPQRTVVAVGVVVVVVVVGVVVVDVVVGVV